MFEELESKKYKQKNTWGKNRQKLYQVSVNQFVKALVIIDERFMVSYLES